MLSGYVQLRASAIARQIGHPERISVQLLLESIDAQIRTVAEVHRLLATERRDVRVDLGAHLHAVLKPFTSGIFGDVKLTEAFVTGCMVSTEQILPISQIVSEVVTNAVKHGHSGEVVITVRCLRARGGNLLIEVHDNGPGHPPGFNPAAVKSIGLRLLRALVLQLGALVQVRSSPNGLRFRMLLRGDPAPAARA